VATKSYVNDRIHIAPKMKLSNTFVTNRDDAPSCKKEKPAVLTQTYRQQELWQEHHWTNNVQYEVKGSATTKKGRNYGAQPERDLVMTR
jgi:hypothetical protein